MRPIARKLKVTLILLAIPLALVVYQGLTRVPETETLWQMGIAQLQEDARKGSNEVVSFYLLAEAYDGSLIERWTGRKYGDLIEAEPDLEDSKVAIDEISKTRPRKLQIVMVHTHPRLAYTALKERGEAALERVGLRGVELMSRRGLTLAPPSPQDLSLEVGLSEYARAKGYAFEIEEVAVVVDSLGLWYFDAFTDEDISLSRSLSAEDFGVSREEELELQRSRNPINQARRRLMIDASERSLAASEIKALPSYRSLLFSYFLTGSKVVFNDGVGLYPASALVLNRTLLGEFE